MPTIRLTSDVVTAQERIRGKAAHLREARTVLLNVVQGEQGGVIYLADWAKIVRGTVAHALGSARTHWRQVLKRATTILVSIAAVACGTLPLETKPTPVVPLTLQRETAETIFTSTPTPTATPTITPSPIPPPTATATATPKPIETLTPTPMATVAAAELADVEIVASNRIATLRPELFVGRQPGKHSQYTEGDYLYLIHKNVAPDTIIERLDTYPNFIGPVIHVKLGNSPPPDPTDLQRAYVNFDRFPDRQVRGPWGVEHSFVLLNAPPTLDYRGSADSTTTILTSILYRNPSDWTFYGSFGGVKLYTLERGRYYISVYRANKPDSSPTMDIDSRRLEIELNKKYALRMEVYWNSADNKPHVRGYLATFDNKGQKVYHLIGDLPCDDHILDIKGDVSWVGLYTGSKTRNMEIIVGESTLFRLK